jgi:hypothetical protein
MGNRSASPAYTINILRRLLWIASSSALEDPVLLVALSLHLLREAKPLGHGVSRGASDLPACEAGG